MRAILLVGLPGCGKTTLAETMPGMVEINRDRIRERLFGSRMHHAHEGAVSREHARLIRHHAARGDDLLISDTHTQRRSRRDLIRVLKELGYQVEVWVLDVSEEVCQARNQQRPQPVPPEVISRMSRRLTEAPPSLAEGMDALRMIRQDGVASLLT
jgi:predicted kinase